MSRADRVWLGQGVARGDLDGARARGGVAAAGGAARGRPGRRRPGVPVPAAHGGPVSANRGLLRLAAAVRGGTPEPGRCVRRVAAARLRGEPHPRRHLVRAGPGPGRAVADDRAGLHRRRGRRRSPTSGRLDRASAAMPLAQAADHLLPVAATSPGVGDAPARGAQRLVAGGIAQHGTVNIGADPGRADDSRGARLRRPRRAA